jgi:hypothetical protein
MEEVNVEETLIEIRERVRAQIRQQSSIVESQGEPPTTTPTNEVALDSLRANLSVIERSWNRLPPLTTFRTGSIARLELWVKRLLKKATHWFTWEQVNFNSASAKSMKEIITVLSEHEEELMELRRQLQRFDSIARDGANWQPEGHDQQAVTRSDAAAVRDKSSAGGDDAQSDMTEMSRRIEELRAIRARHDTT